MVGMDENSAPAGGAPTPRDGTGSPVGRRVVLGMVGLGVLGILTGRYVQDALSTVVSNDPTGLTGLLPGAEGFRYYSVTPSEPVVSTAAYRLVVSGRVAHPQSLTYADLQAMPPTHLTRDFQCVTGWRVSNVAWSGVALPDLLDAVGADPAAPAVLFRSFDGTYTESLTRDQARRRDVLVATSMLGGPVTQAHGGPLRLYVAPMYGYKSIKWLGGIEVADHVVPGYWERLGYDVDAWVGRSNGRSDAPTS